MKPLFIVGLTGTVTLNVVLLGLLVAGRAGTIAPAAAAAPAAARATAQPGAGPPEIDGRTWERLRAENRPAMVAQLRAAGFPPELVRAIMAAQLREDFAARRKAIDPGADSRPFWKSTSMDAGVLQALRQLDREQQKLLRELLGPDAEAESMIGLYQGRRLDGIPADKIPEVKRLLQQFNDARSDVYGSGGMIGAEQQKKLAALERDQRAALAAILTPQELVEYEVRNSDSARSVRYQLSAFNPTEEEFRTIHRLQADFDDQFGRLYAVPTPDEQRRRNEAQRQMDEQIKAALGPVRAADYERATDYSYRQTSQLVARLELPPETTQQVWDVQKDLQTRLRQTYTAGTPPADRAAQLGAIAREAETRITAILGPRGFEAYQQYGGSWMQSLRPRPAPTPLVPAPGK